MDQIHLNGLDTKYMGTYENLSKTEHGFVYHRYNAHKNQNQDCSHSTHQQGFYYLRFIDLSHLCDQVSIAIT